MNKTQTWIPDTHPQATLIIQWDDEDIEAPHVCTEVTIDNVVQPDPQEVYESILAENRLKNQALKVIIDTLPDTMKKDVLDSDGDPTGERIIKDKHNPIWLFGEIDRKISFTVPGIDDTTKGRIVEAISAQFGEQVNIVESLNG